jgi:hypothetical protein
MSNPAPTVDTPYAPLSASALSGSNIYVRPDGTITLFNISLRQVLLTIGIVAMTYYCGPPSGYLYHFATYDVLSALRLLPLAAKLIIATLFAGFALYTFSEQARYYWTYYTYSPKAAMSVEQEYKARREAKKASRASR